MRSLESYDLRIGLQHRGNRRLNPILCWRLYGERFSDRFVLQRVGSAAWRGRR
jgi:hypothetical protein